MNALQHRDDKSRLLAMIGNMTGRTITRELARSCRDLAGYEAPASEQIELMKNQLLILMLRDLGGSKKYTVDAIDDETAGYVMTIQQIPYRGKVAFEFKIKKK